MSIQIGHHKAVSGYVSIAASVSYFEHLLPSLSCPCY